MAHNNHMPFLITFSYCICINLMTLIKPREIRSTTVDSFDYFRKKPWKICSLEKDLKEKNVRIDVVGDQ